MDILEASDHTETIEAAVKAHADGMRWKAQAFETAWEYLKANTTDEERKKLVSKLEMDARTGSDGIDVGFRTMVFNFFSDNVSKLKEADDTNPKDKELCIKASLYLVYAAWKNYDLPSQVDTHLHDSNVVQKIQEFVKKSKEAAPKQ